MHQKKEKKQKNLENKLLWNGYKQKKKKKKKEEITAKKKIVGILFEYSLFDEKNIITTKKKRLATTAD